LRRAPICIAFFSLLFAQNFKVSSKRKVDCCAKPVAIFLVVCKANPTRVQIPDAMWGKGYSNEESKDKKLRLQGARCWEGHIGINEGEVFDEDEEDGMTSSAPVLGSATVGPTLDKDGHHNYYYHNDADNADKWPQQRQMTTKWWREGEGEEEEEMITAVATTTMT
jgi:hypothetical protein